MSAWASYYVAVQAQGAAFSSWFKRIEKGNQDVLRETLQFYTNLALTEAQRYYFCSDSMHWGLFWELCGSALIKSLNSSRRLVLCYPCLSDDTGKMQACPVATMKVPGSITFRSCYLVSSKLPVRLPKNWAENTYIETWNLLMIDKLCFIFYIKLCHIYQLKTLQAN